MNEMPAKIYVPVSCSLQWSFITVRLVTKQSSPPLALESTTSNSEPFSLYILVGSAHYIIHSEKLS